MSPAELPPLPFEPEYCVVARRDDSLARRGRAIAFALAAMLSLSVAAAFLVAGAWPILPWSLLEVGLLGLAFVLLERRSRDWERLAIRGDTVLVERVRGGLRQQRSFNRRWLRVELDGVGRGEVPNLTLAFAGERMGFGKALSPARRIEVARALARLTGR